MSVPNDPRWSSIPSATVELEPVPLEAQPNDYIRAAFQDRPYGTITTADIASEVDGDNLHVRLTWDAPSSDDEFPDAAALIFPHDEQASLLTHGSPEHAVEMWYWRSVFEGGEVLESTGPGVVRRTGSVNASATRSEGRWSVVFSGAVPSHARMGVALWAGSNSERAGIGSVTPAWVELHKGDRHER